MEYTEAKQRVLAYLNQDRLPSDQVGVYEPATELEWGWVFHFNLVEAIGPSVVTDKVWSLMQTGKTQEEAEALLTETERLRMNKEMGLVGNFPFFIDKDTRQIYPVGINPVFSSNWLRIFEEKLRDEKNGWVSSWAVYLTENLRGQPAKLTSLRHWMGWNAAEVMAAIKQPENPLIIGDIEYVCCLHEGLLKAGIEAELRRIGISYTRQDTSDPL